MIVPPKPYSEKSNGGYLLNEEKKKSLQKTIKKKIKKLNYLVLIKPLLS